MTTAQIRCR